MRESLIGCSYQLYLRQGNEQLRQGPRRAGPSRCASEVVETEHKFQMDVGSAKVAGRARSRPVPDTVAVVVQDRKPKSQEEADDSLQLTLYALAGAAKPWANAPTVPDLSAISRKQHAGVRHKK